MRSRMRFLSQVLTLLCIMGIILNFGGCSKDTPLEPPVSREDRDPDFPPEISEVLAANVDDDYDIFCNDDNGYNFPLHGSHTFKLLTWGWRNRCQFYQGGVVWVSNGTKFYVFPGAITPPPGGEGQPVIITMTVDKDENGDLIFSFGPSGTQFNPRGLVRLSWKGLNPKHDEVVKLFYIDSDGQYNEQGADYIDYKGQSFYLFIDHFSRYAISKCR